MAVYYKWIKGCGEGANLDEGIWTYIKWASVDSQEVSNDAGNLPTMYVSIGREDSPEVSLGYLLTNNAKGVEINHEWVFTSGFTVGSLNFNKNNISTTSDINWIINDNLVLSIKENQLQTNKIEVKDLEISNQLNSEGKITSKDSVHAPYFNATSDVRAKENIKKLSFSALSFINNLPVYQFNYINQVDTIPGVLAQDVLQSQPLGLSLVDNLEASGENGDYMSIKEDKFIFILMRAIQELKQDNDNLRYEIDILKQKLKK